MKRISSGFTLVELMVVIVIVGIAAAIGLPNFVPMISKVRMDGEMSALVSGLNFARSEAVKRGLQVSVCPVAANGTSCAPGTDWSAGWIVQLNGPPTQMLLSTAAMSRDRLTSNSTATPSYPQFTSMGYTFFADTLTLHDSVDTPSLRRCLVFASGAWTSKTGAICP